jgi:prepilin-type N-terminal cleavage/methylation domain-containing protein
MMMSPQSKENNMQTQRLQKGFTLIELGIALMIIGILTATFTPGLIAATRNKLVEKVAEDMRIIAEATMVFQAQNEGTLPGEPDAEDDCVTTDAINVLQGEGDDAGYLPETLQDPWGGDYALEYVRVDDTCITKIKTELGTLPFASQTMLSAMLPATECTGTDDASSQCVTTDLTFLAGAAGEEGQIRMFASECPAGWGTYDELADRFPRGITAGGWATAQENQTGGSSTLTIDYGHTGIYSGITTGNVEEIGETLANEFGEDIAEALVGFYADADDGDWLTNNPASYQALSQLSVRQNDGVDWCDFNDEDCINTEDDAVGSASDTMNFVPSYAYINYCKKL